jgi:hypothetical protein
MVTLKSGLAQPSGLRIGITCILPGTTTWGWPSSGACAGIYQRLAALWRQRLGIAQTTGTSELHLELEQLLVYLKQTRCYRFVRIHGQQNFA